MPLKIMVPLERVQQALNSGLVLAYPKRCSRCGAVPAEDYETHSLRLRIGRKRPGLYRQTYKVDRPYRLKIRVCQTCYRTDFATSVEEMEKDDTSAGRLARIYSRLYTVGGVVACAGMLLMTRFIPADSALGGVKAYWPYIVGLGGAIILAVWLHQRYRTRKLIEELESAGVSLDARPRAKIYTPVPEDKSDPSAIVLEINLHDDDWAAECAAYYHFQTAEYTPGVFQGE